MTLATSDAHLLAGLDAALEDALAASLAAPSDGEPDLAPDDERSMLRDADGDSTEFCARCSFFQAPAVAADETGTCVVVEGRIGPVQVFDQFVQRAEPPEVVVELPDAPGAETVAEPEPDVVEVIEEDEQAALPIIASIEALAEHEDDEPEPDALPQRFRILLREGEETGDRRFINVGALSWRDDVPLTLSHSDNAVEVVGTVETFRREDGGILIADGRFDLDGEFGREAARLVADGMLTGVSPELVNVEHELDCDTEGDCLETIVAGRIAVLSIVTRPALESARIEAIAAGLASLDAPIEDLPPVSWFQDPGMAEPMPLTVDDSGRILGHAALWGSCHTGRFDVCLLPPRSLSDYAYFRLGELRAVAADGSTLSVPVGAITLGTGHAATRGISAASAAAHYDNTGTVAADVVCGEDEHGIWISGRVRPDVLADPGRRAALEASKLSGDWRRLRGNLELVAILCVNVPGFAVPRIHAAMASGEQSSLVAAGILPDALGDVEPCGCGSCDDATVSALGRLEADVASLRSIVSTLGLDAQAIDSLAASLRS
jgi:hypothetical protein